MLAVHAGADVYQCALPAGGIGTLVARHVPDSVRNPQTYATQHVSNTGRHKRLAVMPFVSRANQSDDLKSPVRAHTVVERRSAGDGSIISDADVLHCEFRRPVMLNDSEAVVRPAPH